MPEGAQVPASRTAFSSASVICSALYWRTLRRSLKTFSVSFMLVASFLTRVRGIGPRRCFLPVLYHIFPGFQGFFTAPPGE